MADYFTLSYSRGVGFKLGFFFKCLAWLFFGGGGVTRFWIRKLVLWGLDVWRGLGGGRGKRGGVQVGFFFFKRWLFTCLFFEGGRGWDWVGFPRGGFGNKLRFDSITRFWIRKTGTAARWVLDCRMLEGRGGGISDVVDGLRGFRWVGGERGGWKGRGKEGRGGGGKNSRSWRLSAEC